MNLDEIRNEVMHIIDDSSFDTDTVTAYINKALEYTVGVVDIPELKNIFNVSTVANQAYVHLGNAISNFGGKLRRVRYNSKAVEIFPSLETLMDAYDDLDEEGDVISVALEGRNLWYQKIPTTASSLTVLCYTNPEPLSESNTTVSCIPEYCQKAILVSGAAHYCWKLIEEEDSGFPVTNRYYAEYQDGIQLLREWVARNRQSIGYSHWRY